MRIWKVKWSYWNLECIWNLDVYLDVFMFLFYFMNLYELCKSYEFSMDYVWFMKFWMDYVWMFKSSWSFLLIKKSYSLFQKLNKFKNSWVPTNTHEYFNTHGYSHNGCGYPCGYGADMSIIFIQRGGHGYRTIRVNGYPLTSLIWFIKLGFPIL